MGRQRRRHVQNVVAARGGFTPAGVTGEIGREQRQALARLDTRLPEHGAHVRLAIEAAHRGAHLMARGQELRDAMAADKAGSAGHQHKAHDYFHRAEKLPAMPVYSSSTTI